MHRQQEFRRLFKLGTGGTPLQTFEGDLSEKELAKMLKSK
jgi:hypothetical protein